MLTLLGRYVQVEVHQARGCVVCIIEARSHVYVVAFKRDGRASEALVQIKDKNYAAPFEADPRELHLIGCAFDPATRLMSEWEVR